jgi:hypothetical protein
LKRVSENRTFRGRRLRVQAVALAQVGDGRLDFGAFAAVDHAEQVVRPVRQAARAAVAQRDRRLLGQGAADFADRSSGMSCTSMALAV